MPSSRLTAADVFQCKKCGDCCKGYGGTYLAPGDVTTIAHHLHITEEKLLADYCRLSGGKPLLAQQRNGYCLFWDEVCTIHPVKPRMCRAWPFIKAVLIEPGNWEIMAGMCPGIRLDVPDRQIVEIVRREIKRMEEKSSK
ncbi:MAG: YkgJ family cysteine cluster protein [Thermodesulfobacteriota bacterium]